MVGNHLTCKTNPSTHIGIKTFYIIWKEWSFNTYLTITDDELKMLCELNHLSWTWILKSTENKIHKMYPKSDDFLFSKFNQLTSGFYLHRIRDVILSNFYKSYTALYFPSFYLFKYFMNCKHLMLFSMTYNEKYNW